MKILKVLRVFFRMKGEELKDWFGKNKENIYISASLIFALQLGLIFLLAAMEDFSHDSITHKILICELKIIGSIAGLAILFLIGFGIFCFFKWFKKLCKDNWQKAKKEVEQGGV